LIETPKPNLLDKIVTAINPTAGMRRLQARGMMAFYGAYTGARRDRRGTREWFTSRGNADADTLLDLWELRARSRDLVRNAPIATGAVNTVVANAVGTGLTLQPTPDLAALGWTDKRGAKWIAEVESEFKLWADSFDCDVTRTQNFSGMQDLALRSTLESGDVFALLPFVSRDHSPYSLAVQLLEADRVRNPLGAMEGGKIDGSNNRCWSGVEVDMAGAPVSYIIMRQHPGALNPAGQDLYKWDRVAAFGQKTGRRNVLHIFDRRRPEQKRGVPYLAPVIETLKQLDRYTEAEIMAAVISSMFTVFVKTDTGQDGIGQAPEAAPSNQPNAELKMGTGSILDLRPGEDVSFADPKRPNPVFDSFVQSIFRQIGVSLEIPFEVLVKHFTASYSAARAALMEAWRFYLNRRTFISAYFCQPIYEAWMEEAVALGRISAPGFFGDPMIRRAYLSAEWIGDAPGTIDPKKEVEAATGRVALGISSRKIECMQLTGKNWDDVNRQLALEKDERVKSGLEPAITVATTDSSGSGGGNGQDNQQQDNGGNDTEKA
jgi:lambda family phage portal protein